MRLVRLWLIWFAFVCFVSLPWIGFTPYPRWERVQWVPFSDRADRPSDFVLNAIVFLPLGFAAARRRALPSALVLAALMSVTISVTAEATQLFSTRRFPSATDVTAAVMGALGGAVSTVLLAHSSKPETWTD
jgi:glycopeptide antibiotics resistance protein